MVSKVKTIIKRIIHKLAGNKYLMFESTPDFSDNTKAVFDEMLCRGLNNKYTLLWLFFEENRGVLPQIDNVKCIKPNNPLFKYYRAATKCFISCNRFELMEKFCDNDQLSIYLDHGNPLKDPGIYAKLPDGIDYCLSSSSGMVPYKQMVQGISDANRIVSLGFPRNDAFSKAPIDLHGFFKTDYDKIIAWYPTFRQHKDGSRIESSITLPIIHDIESSVQLNQFAKERNVLIVVKPHFAQDVSYVTDLKLSNITFINDEFFKMNRIVSYEFLNGTDAMLTDYSSVYYDYTLHDKPVGLIWEDIDEYKANLGLVGGYEELTKGGVKIYNLKDLEQFVDDIACGIDLLKQNRRESRDFANLSTDGQNAKRVVDFIIEKAGL